MACKRLSPFPPAWVRVKCFGKNFMKRIHVQPARIFKNGFYVPPDDHHCTSHTRGGAMDYFGHFHQDKLIISTLSIFARFSHPGVISQEARWTFSSQILGKPQFLQATSHQIRVRPHLDGSKLVFSSVGLVPLNRTLMIFFNMSNQKEAPGLAAAPERRIPASLISHPVRSVTWGELMIG
jgi:hypothetical protein